MMRYERHQNVSHICNFFKVSRWQTESLQVASSVLLKQDEARTKDSWIVCENFDMFFFCVKKI